MRKYISFGVPFGLTVLACITCIRIEILNVKAGNFLPRLDNDGTWRVMARPERMLRERYTREYRTEHSLEMEAPLPPEAIASIERRVSKEVPIHLAEIELRDIVSGWGLLQYLLIPIGIVSSTHLFRYGRHVGVKIAAVLFILLNIACGIMMIYRAYYPSLGW